jgi:hypothetical protein
VAGEKKMSARTTYRTVLSLDGVWRFKTDPNDAGEKSNWHSTSLDDSSWDEIRVPSVWESCGYVDYDGTAWYRKRFNLSTVFAGKRISVEFGAVDYFSKIWINSIFLGEHEGGYTPFKFDATDAIKIGGENTIVVRVYDPNKESKDFSSVEILDGKQGWDAFRSPPSEYLRLGGIWQSVKMVGTPSEGRIEDASVKATRLSERLVELQIRFELGKNTSTSELAIPSNSDVRVIVEIESFNFEGPSHRQEFRVEPKYGDITEAKLGLRLGSIREWSPPEPNLYVAKVTLELNGKSIDEYEVKFGFREFLIRDGAFYLNGKRVFLRGALVQGFYPSTIYSAPSREYVKNEIQLAKAAGLNLLRLHIKIFEPFYLDLADEMGMLLWVELPIISPKRLTAKFNVRALKELQEMVKRDVSHPSIVIWGIFNELSAFLSPSGSEYNTSLSLLTSEVKKLDDTRLVCQDSWVEQPKFGDFGDGHWYYEIPRQMGDLEKRIQGIRKQPFIVSEFGGWGYPDFQKADKSVKRPFTHDGEEIRDFLEKHNIVKKDLKSFQNYIYETQKLQGEALADQIKEFKVSGNIAGYVLTELYDVPCEYNGILDYFRNKKLSYGYVAEANRDICIKFPPDRVILVNKKVTLPITIVNYSQKTLRNVKVSFETSRVKDEEKNAEGSRKGTKTLNELAPYRSIDVPISFDVAENLFIDHIKLDVRVHQDQETEDSVAGSFEVLAMARKWLSLPGKTVCVIEEESGVSHNLRELNIGAMRLNDNAELALKTSKAVVVAGNVSDLITQELQDLLAEYLEKGGKLIVAPQSSKFTLFGNQYSVRALPEPWMTPFHFAQSSDLLRGFYTNLLSYEFIGVYPKYVYGDLPLDHEVVACVTVAAQPRKFFGVTLARRTVGAGSLILCQFEINKDNPAAALLIRNILVDGN